MGIDTIGLIESFNLFVLPPLVAVVVFGEFLWGRRASQDPSVSHGEAEATRGEWLDRERTVRRIGLLNYGLALQAVVSIVPEIQNYLATGSFWSFAVVAVYVPMIVIAVNVVIALGLRRLHAWARWMEVVWNLLTLAVTLPLEAWRWRFGAALVPSEWPERIAVLNVLPFFLVVVMLLPGTARVVSAKHRALIAETPGATGEPTRRSVVSSLTLGFLIILGSIVILNAIDWVIRIRPEMANVG
ncbi:hypothetical protein ACYOEI_11385 [Singulisphaera rosea]